jgi:cytochrome c nitrite reductase small subunit
MATSTVKHGRFGVVVRLVAAVFVGAAIGAAGFGLQYSKATSYLGSDPLTCVNCHVMQKEYDAWSRGPHANVATCVDCHVPQDSVVSKYLVKLEDGWLHGKAFTLGDYPANITIRDSSLEVANASCRTCHGNLTDSMFYAMGTDETEITCVRCHEGIGHSD